MKQKVQITVTMIVNCDYGGQGRGVKGGEKLKSKVGQGLRFNRNTVTWVFLKTMLKYLQFHTITLDSFDCG